MLFVFLILSMISTDMSTSSRLPKEERRRKVLARETSSNNRSSLLVPDFLMLIAGNFLLSAIFLSRIISLFPVPLNSSKMTSSILLPVSMRAVDMIVRLPPSSMFLAAPKNLLGLWRALESTPPERIFPEAGTVWL